MTRELDRFWDGALEGMAFDVARQSVLLRMRAGRHAGELVLRGLTELRFFNPSGAPWAHAELTEIWLFPLAGERARLEITLWSDDAGIVAECDVVLLDGVPLEGRAR